MQARSEQKAENRDYEGESSERAESIPARWLFPQSNPPAAPGTGSVRADRRDAKPEGRFLRPAPMPGVKTPAGHPCPDKGVVTEPVATPAVEKAGRGPPPGVETNVSAPDRPVRQGFRPRYRFPLSIPSQLRLQLARVHGRCDQRRATTLACKSEKRVSLNFLGADINDVLKALSVPEQAAILWPDKDVTGNVTVSLSKVTVEEALAYVAKFSGYGYTQDNGTYLVAQKDKLNSLVDTKDQQTAGRKSFLRYTRPDEMIAMLESQFPGVQASSTSGSMSARRTSNDSAIRWPERRGRFRSKKLQTGRNAGNHWVPRSKLLWPSSSLFR